MGKVAQACGRNPEEIQLLAVSKMFPAWVVSRASVSGQIRFGENRVQEAEVKIAEVSEPSLEWHLIGHLQQNKVRRAVQIFNVIQTLDGERLVGKVAKCAREIDKVIKVYIQVNLGREIQKHGASPSAVAELVRLVDQFSSLSLGGLMAIPPYTKDAEASRPYFRDLSQLAHDVSNFRAEPVTGLSMGMSHDYRVAIQEGATLIRIGSGLFGNRPS